MEYCSNGTLQDAVMYSDGILSEIQVRVAMQCILEALVYLHGRNICHRDIKPHNFMLVAESPSALQCYPSPLQVPRNLSADGVVLASGLSRPMKAPVPVPRSISTPDGYPAPDPLHRAPLASTLTSGPQASPFKAKLGDFGTATRVPPGQLIRQKVGTPAFMAPEMHLLPARSP